MVEGEGGVGVDLFDIVEEVMGWLASVGVEHVVGVVRVEVEQEPSGFNVKRVPSM